MSRNTCLVFFFDLSVWCEMCAIASGASGRFLNRRPTFNSVVGTLSVGLGLKGPSHYANSHKTLEPTTRWLFCLPSVSDSVNY